MPLAPDGAPSIHSAPPGEACTLLSSRPEGLTKEEAVYRLRSSGPNVLRKPRGRPLYRKLLSQFTHLMAILLWIGGLVAGSPYLDAWYRIVIPAAGFVVIALTMPKCSSHGNVAILY